MRAQLNPEQLHEHLALLNRRKRWRSMLSMRTLEDIDVSSRYCTIGYVHIDDCTPRICTYGALYVEVRLASWGEGKRDTLRVTTFVEKVGLYYSHVSAHQLH